MSREIKFRGKCAFSGVWRYGYFYISKGNYIIRDSEDKESIILKESVGQYAGLKNNKGIEIYEGDIILSYGNKYLVEFTPCDGLKLCIIYPDDLEIKGIIQTHENWSYNKASGCNVLGNIHENPELLNQPI